MVGLIFLFFSGAGRWLTWFVIPAGAFLTLGIVTLVFGWNRFFSPDSASLFSLGFGLTFLTLFYFRRGHWWVLIPSGVFIGLSIWVEMVSRFPVTGWHPVAPLLFLGISFLVIWLYSVQKQRMKWSLLVGALIVERLLPVPAGHPAGPLEHPLARHPPARRAALPAVDDGRRGGGPGRNE